jgi:isopentenyldiphosphate isomerase
MTREVYSIGGYCMFNGCFAGPFKTEEEKKSHAASHPTASHPTARQILRELGLDAPALYKKMEICPHLHYGSMLFIASSLVSLADPEKISKFNGRVRGGGLIEEIDYVFEVTDSPTERLSGKDLEDWLARN